MKSSICLNCGLDGIRPAIREKSGSVEGSESPHPVLCRDKHLIAGKSAQKTLQYRLHTCKYDTFKYNQSTNETDLL